MKKLVVISLQLAVFLLLICGQVWSAEVTAWWDTDYEYRKLLSCGDHDEYSTNHFLKYVGLDVTGDDFMDNGNDIRVVRQTTSGQTDLDRYLYGANTSSAEIYWKVQATIPEDEDIGGEDDYKIYLYYGNSEAGSPETYTNVYCVDAPLSAGFSIALWHYDETSGGTLYDETGDDYDATVVNATIGQTGKFGKSVEFDGEGDYTWVELTPPAATITIQFWVYPDADSQVILGFNETYPGGPIWDRGFAIDKDQKIRWKVYDEASRICVSSTTVPLDEWTHVAGTITDNDSMKLWINGTREDVEADVDGGYNGYVSPIFITGDEYWTGWELAYNLHPFFDGKIDEVRIWSNGFSNFYHITNEATITLGSEEEAPVTMGGASLIQDQNKTGIAGGGIAK